MPKDYFTQMEHLNIVLFNSQSLCPSPTVRKVQPTGQIWPNICFLKALEVRILLSLFFYYWLNKKIKKRRFYDIQKLYEIKCSVSMRKVLWNIATPFHFHFVYDCLY